MSQQNFDQYSQYLIDRYVPLVLFVNEELDILYAHGPVEQYLNFPRALVKYNVSKMLDGKNQMLFKSGIAKCRQENNTVLYRELKFEKSDGPRLADVRIQPTNLEGTGQQVFLVEILPADPDREPAPELEDEGSFDPSIIWEDQIKKLKGKLREARYRAQSLVDEQEATNEELQASNRELMASNEELQSTNEELQSVNEELYTVNSELQIKNEALSTANNDTLNLLRSIDIGTIFLDKDLKVRRFTPAIQKHFNLLEIDLGRPISDFSSNLVEVDISRISRQVYHTLEKYEQEVRDINGNHYLLRVFPYRTQEDQIEGLVITFVDVNELIRIREQMRTFAKKFKAIFQHAEGVILELDANGIIRNASDSVGPFSEDALSGKKFFDLIPEESRQQLEAEIKKMSGRLYPVYFDLEIDKSREDYSSYQGTLIPLGETRDKSTGLTGLIVVLRDLTEYIKRQKALASSQQEYRALMDNAHHQIILIDQHGQVQYVNYIHHIDLSTNEITGTSIYDYLPGPERERLRRSIESLVDKKTFETIKFMMAPGNDNKSEVELIATPVIVDDHIRHIALFGQEGKNL